MKIFLALVVFLLALAGLSQLYFYEPEHDEYILALAGKSAIICGTVNVCDDSTKYDRCAVKALNENNPFAIWYWIQGIDSRIGYGFSLNDKGELNAIEYGNYNILPIKIRHFYRVFKCSKPELKLVLGKQRIDCVEAELIHYVNENPVLPAFCD
jgi:hypothetical protein